MQKKFEVFFSVALMSVFIINPIYAQSDLLPSWMKNTAGFWSEDQISDAEFISFIQFLIDEKIISVVNDSEFDDSSEELSKESVCNELYKELVEITSKLLGTEQKLKALSIYAAFSQDDPEDLENVKEEIKRIQKEYTLEFKERLDGFGDTSYCKDVLTKTQIHTILFLDEGRIT